MTACGGGNQSALALSGGAGSIVDVLAPGSTGDSTGTEKLAALSPAQTQTVVERHPGLYVDMSAVPAAQPGVSKPMLSAPGPLPPLPAEGNWEQGGAIRLICNWTKMSYDDPIVYPGQPGASHNHTFFGNTAIDAYTTSDNIRSQGNASCRGGTINLSGYWVPTMVDVSTHRPVVPNYLLIYYKTGAWQYMNDNSVMQPIPKGLKIIAGEAMRSTPGGVGSFVCAMPGGGDRPGTEGKSIPHCMPGDELRAVLPFPQCWDGKNLDSPDHKSHMAYPELHWSGNPERQYRCPVTHPVVLPQITFIVDYGVPSGSDTANWRLASDMYDESKPGGYSFHGDWMNGWDPEISELWGINCERARRDCGSTDIGDGRQTLEFQGN
jgi:hypothetical protein